MRENDSWGVFLRLDQEREAVRSALRPYEVQALREMDDLDGIERATAFPGLRTTAPLHRSLMLGLVALGACAGGLLVAGLMSLFGAAEAGNDARRVERQAVLQAATVYAAGATPEVECRVITPALSARMTGSRSFTGCVRSLDPWAANPLRKAGVTSMDGTRASVVGTYSDGRRARYKMRRITGRWLVDEKERLNR